MSVDCTNNDAVEYALNNSKIDKSIITSAKVVKRSVDARRGDINLVYAVEIEYLPVEKEKNEFTFGTKKLKGDIVIVGAGPAGLFCAYTLTKNGYKCVLAERGQSVYERVKSVDSFYKSGNLNINSNVQFGEGGAGTFSDGKLTTRVGDARSKIVLETFVENGAKEDILYAQKPHIGTDMLKDIVANMRKEIIKNGGVVLFDTTVSDVVIKNNQVYSVITNRGEIPAEKVILAIGHSARDTYSMLYKKGIAMEAKAFAMGYRIEHKREFIDYSQYGKYAGHKNLGSADYRLTYNGKDRSCFSFCMCPGGYVVAAASENGGITVNGMSENSRNGENSNSAIVAQITPNDYEGVLGGIELQRKYESLAYGATNSFVAPIQNTEDFINGKVSKKLNGVVPSYPLGYEFADLGKLMPAEAVKTLREGLKSFDRKIKNFTTCSVLTGVETRTSAPLRILRNELMESINVCGLMPIGEGAGYAGGIMSAAIDGIKAAERIMSVYDRN